MRLRPIEISCVRLCSATSLEIRIALEALPLCILSRVRVRTRTRPVAKYRRWLGVVVLVAVAFDLSSSMIDK